MSDHVDGPRSIGDPAADVSDLFAFTSPENPARTVLAMCVFPSAGVDAVFSNAIDHCIAVRRVTLAGVGNAARFQPANGEMRFVANADGPVQNARQLRAHLIGAGTLRGPGPIELELPCCRARSGGDQRKSDGDGGRAIRSAATPSTHVPLLAARVRAAFHYRKKTGRREFVRSSLRKDDDGILVADKFPVEGAGLITSLTRTHGLVQLAEDLTVVEPGDWVDYLDFALLR